MSDAWGTLSVPARATGAARGYAGPDGAAVDRAPSVALPGSAAGSTDAAGGDAPDADAHPKAGADADRPAGANVGTDAGADPELLRRYRQCATWCGCLVTAIACIGLTGRLTGVMVLAAISSAWPAMRQNTALGLIAAGGALALHGVGGHRRWLAVRISRLCSVLVLVLVGVTIAEIVSGSDLGVDHMLMAERPDAGGIADPGRMAPLAALIFVLDALALLTLASARRRWRMLSPVCALPAAVAAMVMLLGYAFGASELYAVAGRFTAVAATTAAAFVLLGGGILFTNLPGGPLRGLASPGLGGVMLRRMLPVSMVVMTAVVWFRLLAQSWGLFDSIGFGAASVTVVLMVAVGGMLSWCAGLLDRLDRARRQGDEQIRRLNVALGARLLALEAANREFQGFSYSMSHVLRSPLRAIHGYAQLVLEDFGADLGAEGQRLLGAVQSSTEELSELLDGILAFLRLGWQHMTIVPVDMGQEVLAAIEQLHGRTAGRDIRFEVGELPAAQADASMVRRVWLNLLDNAVKFTGSRDAARIAIGAQAGTAPSGTAEVGTLRVGGAQAGGARTTYYVSDNGAGFDMRYVAKLFGIFQRLHPATQFSGTGIGLAIVNRIVTRHGGRAWAEGRPGEGATFYFSLPSAETAHV